VEVVDRTVSFHLSNIQDYRVGVGVGVVGGVDVRSFSGVSVVENVVGVEIFPDEIYVSPDEVGYWGKGVLGWQREVGWIPCRYVCFHRVPGVSIGEYRGVSLSPYDSEHVVRAGGI